MVQEASGKQGLDVVRGHRIGGQAQTETRRFAVGRTCAAERCTTRLSAYNPSRYCWLHEAPHPYFVRADRRKPTDDEPTIVRPEDLRQLLRGA
jgi:hypothetical protein